jgi:hypothetical protein
VLTKSPDLHTHQLADPAITAGTDDRELPRGTDHDMPIHCKASKEERDTVLEFQSRVMSAFIADPTAWLRRERWHLKIDNTGSTTRSRGIKLNSDAGLTTSSSNSVTESQLSSEDLTIEDADGGFVSPAHIKSQSEPCKLPDSSLAAERDAHYLALNGAALYSNPRCQKPKLLEDLTLEQHVDTDSQERVCRNHPSQTHMNGCFEGVNTKWLHRTNGDEDRKLDIVRESHSAGGN